MKRWLYWCFKLKCCHFLFCMLLTCLTCHQISSNMTYVMVWLTLTDSFKDVTLKITHEISDTIQRKWLWLLMHKPIHCYLWQYILSACAWTLVLHKINFTCRWQVYNENDLYLTLLFSLWLGIKVHWRCLPEETWV